MSLQIKIAFDDVASMAAFINYNLDSLQTTEHDASGKLVSAQTYTSSEMNTLLGNIHPSVIITDLDLDLLDD